MLKLKVDESQEEGWVPASLCQFARVKRSDVTAVD